VQPTSTSPRGMIEAAILRPRVNMDGAPFRDTARALIHCSRLRDPNGCPVLISISDGNEGCCSRGSDHARSNPGNVVR
jgi:hypothetical protein